MSQPGWDPDPAGSGGLRRWDGAQWTNDVRSAAGTGAAPRPPGRNGGRGWLLALLVVVTTGAILLLSLVGFAGTPLHGVVAAILSGSCLMYIYRAWKAL